MIKGNSNDWQYNWYDRTLIKVNEPRYIQCGVTPPFSKTKK